MFQNIKIEEPESSSITEEEFSSFSTSEDQKSAPKIAHESLVEIATISASSIDPLNVMQSIQLDLGHEEASSSLDEMTSSSSY